jgi:hypothetical protein
LPIPAGPCTSTTALRARSSSNRAQSPARPTKRHPVPRQR